MTDRLLYLYQYKMNDEENAECDKIIEIVRKYEPNARISSGNPIGRAGEYEDGTPRFTACGDCYDSIMAIKQENGNGFEYFVISVGDRGYFEFCIFEEFYNECYRNDSDSNEKYKMFDAFIEYLIGVKYWVNNNYKYTLIDNYILCVEENDDKLCKLSRVHEYDSKDENRYIDEELCASNKFVFKEAMCEKWHRFYYNSSKEKDTEVRCERCGSKIKEN